ncbi:exodeoxyribonuclease V subunit gamma [Ideonella sp. A 288]|uniref:exodeoxyribonuclease V subunit gamma n=1 Tax=Ideonella sp. A 288 TaxID=1962181 RepID=UPI000B4B6353|nr:exodeoxyribonuclease V subunit gamma [Ideonella sp. A 288]
MLHIHFANRFETLAQGLVQRLGEPSGSVFVPDEVIVPSAAVERWVTLALARRHGICANVRFSYLAQWLWSQMGRVVPGVPSLPAESPWTPSQLTWRVFDALADADWVATHPRLASYLAQADATMRHDLAGRVARLFDQYLTYRPEWMEAWRDGPAATPPVADAGWTAAAAHPDGAWQASLWRRLAAEAPAGGASPTAAFLDALRREGPALVASGRLPARAEVFCLPTLPPVHLGLLQALGGCMDLHVHALNPCGEYWFEVIDRRRLAWLAARGQADLHEEGQRLLAAWGQQTQSQLAGLVDAVGDGVVDDAHFERHPGDTLLARLHNAVLELTELAPGSVALADGDRSIEVHQCHSLTRELEVLHDRLLGLLAGPRPPAPSDILVVLPDLEAAAPLIDAVFGTTPPERTLPYTVTGLGRSGVNGLARAYLMLLALPPSRFAASAVFGLMQQPPVARRLGLDAADLDALHGALLDAGVHWGLDAEHRASLGLPATARHTLADGLDRLFLGHALPADIAEPFGGRLPSGAMEGSQALRLGVLDGFVDDLAKLRRRTAVPLPPHDWPPLLAAALDGFIAADDGEQEDLRELREAIATLGRQFTDSGLRAALPLDVVRQALEALLDDPARGGVPSGAITFSSMSSLRHLPYRVVCVLGLDDGAFPSATRSPEFDLMAAHARRGDRQRRLDERNLFLDLLLAAREHLHLSHVGRSVRDNSALPPSVLVADLLDTLVPAITDHPADPASLARARARLVVAHPLQAFAEAPFRSDSALPLRSHHAEYAQALRGRAAMAAEVPGGPLPAASGTDSDEDVDAAVDSDEADTELDDEPWPDGAAPMFAAPLPEPGDEHRTLTLAQLQTFFGHPCRTLLRRRLGLDLPRPDDELQDDEAAVAGWPQRSALAARLLPALLAGADPAQAQRLALAGTEAPEGALGAMWLTREVSALQAFAERVRAHTRVPVLPPQSLTLDLPVDGQTWRLHAAFGGLRPGGVVRWRYAEPSPRDRLDAWLEHLMLCALQPAGVEPVTTWLTRDDEIRFGPCHEPREALQDLLRLVGHGLREPLYFFPRTSWAFVDGGDSLAKARTAWEGGLTTAWSDHADPAVRLALRGLPGPLDDERVEVFRDCAHRVFGPMLMCVMPDDTA